MLKEFILCHCRTSYLQTVSRRYSAPYRKTTISRRTNPPVSVAPRMNSVAQRVGISVATRARRNDRHISRSYGSFLSGTKIERHMPRSCRQIIGKRTPITDSRPERPPHVPIRHTRNSAPSSRAVYDLRRFIPRSRVSTAVMKPIRKKCATFVFDIKSEGHANERDHSGEHDRPVQQAVRHRDPAPADRNRRSEQTRATDSLQDEHRVLRLGSSKRKYAAN